MQPTHVLAVGTRERGILREDAVGLGRKERAGHETLGSPACTWATCKATKRAVGSADASWAALPGSTSDDDW